MRIVCTTAIARIECQELHKLTDSCYVHKSTKRLRRARKTTAFHHVRWSMPDTKIVFLIYASGRVVILGCVSDAQLTCAVDWLSTQLATQVLQPPSVCNVVSCLDLGQLPPLHSLAQRLTDSGHDVSFEPELSPGIVLRMKDPNSTTMLFRSGKAMVTGVNAFAGVDHASAAIRQTIRSCLPK